MNQKDRSESSFSKFRNLKPKRLTLSTEALVQIELPESESGRNLPLVIKPAIDNVNLLVWTEANRDFIQAQLMTYGAILFQGFGVKSMAGFEGFAKAIAGQLMEYGERSSPRTHISGGVYTSTDHPADQPIVLHNEQSYTNNWPMKIWFFCEQAAKQGGRTPIADSRRIFKRIDPEIVGKFANQKVRYVRNYSEGLGLPWQEVFGSDDKTAVEEYCRRNEINFQWKKDSQLRTWQVRPAVRNHPLTGETIWFNHALFFNVASLEESTRQTLLSVVGEDDLPFNTFYGDGSPIEAAALETIRDAYDRETVSFPWREGDILMLDNMLTAHGREPFLGPRKIVVIMAEPYEDLKRRSAQ